MEYSQLSASGFITHTKYVEDTRFLPPVWKEKPSPIKVNFRALIHIQGVSNLLLGSRSAAADAVSLRLPLRVLKLISVGVLHLTSEGPLLVNCSGKSLYIFLFTAYQFSALGSTERGTTTATTKLNVSLVNKKI